MINYKIILFIVAFFIPYYSISQENLWYNEDFLSYKEFLIKEFGINCGIPDKFKDINKYYILWSVRKYPSITTGYIYGPFFLSSNKKCMIMYSAKPLYISKKDIEISKNNILIERTLNKDTSTTEPKIGTNSDFPRSQITAELKTALGLYYGYKHPLNNDTAKFNFNDYVTIISGKKAREMFNADTIYLYDIPNADSVYFINDKSIEKIRKEKYPYCTGMFIARKDRATMDIKLFFTKKGVRKKEEYVNMLSKHIWYVDDFKHE